MSCEQAVSIDVDRHGDDFPGLAYPLSCLGEAYLGLGESLQAVSVLERAHTFRNHSEVDPLRLAWSRWLLGRALWESSTDRIRGREYVMFAHEQFSEHAEAATSELADVVKWLDDNALSALIERSE